MDTAQKLLFLWPGLPRLWRRGDWSALAIAVAFACGLNFLLVATFVWPELLAVKLSALIGAGWSGFVASWMLRLAWVVLAGFWGWMMLRGAGHAAEVQRDRLPPPAEDLLPLVQAEYLKGHWFEAERIASAMIEKFPGDLEARLLLVAVLRRSSRPQEALRKLGELEQLPGIGRWVMEIQEERKQLQRISAAPPVGGKVDDAAKPNDARTTVRVA